MTRPTVRGAALVAVAVGTYVAARIFGTWELYLLAFAFLAAVGVSWVLVLATGRRLEVARTVTPRRPVAGDPFQLSFRARNGSYFPGLQVTLVDAGGALGDGRPVELETLGPRAERALTAGPWPARRGVHRLPALAAVAEDPLGLIRTRRSFGEALEIVVPPRLAYLRSCALLADLGARHGEGRLRMPTLDAAEFRDIRPHVPGEPLNRVDWKATAKTGSLMLREAEGATDTDVTLLLNGAASCGAGEAQEAAFEVAVQAAGSMSDFALRSGHTVGLLLPENGWRQARLGPGAGSRRRLLLMLARVAPRGTSQLGPSLRALVAGGRRLAESRKVILVVLCLDGGLVQALVALQEEGLSVSVVHVAGREPEPPAESLRLKRLLSAAGVRYLELAPGDDLAAGLAALPRGRRAAGIR